MEDKYDPRTRKLVALYQSGKMFQFRQHMQKHMTYEQRSSVLEQFIRLELEDCDRRLDALLIDELKLLKQEEPTMKADNSPWQKKPTNYKPEAAPADYVRTAAMVLYEAKLKAEEKRLADPDYDINQLLNY